MEVSKGIEFSSSPRIIIHGGDESGNYVPCRVCHCVESEKWANSAFAYLNIVPPSVPELKDNEPGEKGLISGKNRAELESGFSSGKSSSPDIDCGRKNDEPGKKDSIFLENGVELESGFSPETSSLIDLGCNCKNELARVHYACALKWFISRGSTVCEICGRTAKNIRHEDLEKIMACLRDYELVKETMYRGRVDRLQMDAAAEIRCQRLAEIASWFAPQSFARPSSRSMSGQFLADPADAAVDVRPEGAKCAVEGTGILVAAGLLAVILVWLLSPRINKKAARTGLHILLGGTCIMAVILFIRHAFLSKIKCGPTRNWVILSVFWFLVFGVWASRTRHAD